jgi:hypothetical protein
MVCNLRLESNGQCIVFLVLKRHSVMVKGLKSAQQVSSSSQDMYFL